MRYAWFDRIWRSELHDPLVTSLQLQTSIITEIAVVTSWPQLYALIARTGVGKKGPVKTVPVKTVLGKNGPGKKGPTMVIFVYR